PPKLFLCSPDIFLFCGAATPTCSIVVRYPVYRKFRIVILREREPSEREASTAEGPAYASRAEAGASLRSARQYLWSCAENCTPALRRVLFIAFAGAPRRQTPS